MDFDSDETPDLVLKNSEGLCFRLLSRLAVAQFQKEYCNQAHEEELRDSKVWGDFNGDSWPDRARILHDLRDYRVAQGGPHGLSNEVSWLTGYGRVEKLFSWDANGDGRTDLLLQWNDEAGMKCEILTSTAYQFSPSPCPVHRFPIAKN